MKVYDGIVKAKYGITSEEQDLNSKKRTGLTYRKFLQRQDLLSQQSLLGRALNIKLRDGRRFLFYGYQGPQGSACNPHKSTKTIRKTRLLGLSAAQWRWAGIK